MTSPNDIALRPREFATFLLASGELQSRPRARDQQADVAGIALMRRVLWRLIELDPDAIELPTALDQIVGELGEPHGATRAIAVAVRDEFISAAATPELVAWLVARAVNNTHPSR
jgi:hypothetical protein